MAVLVEAISVIVRREAIQSRYAGKWHAFVRESPNHTLCSDGEIVRIGFLKDEAARNFIKRLEQRGLIFQFAGKSQDITVVDQLRGSTCPAHWLEYGEVKMGENIISACWVKGSASKQVIVPPNWRFEGSISQKSGFVRSTVGEAPFSATIMAALKITASGNKISRNAELHERLENKSLPLALSIAEKEGKCIAFSHFAVGVILRLLSKPAQAEVWFRRANELQPHVLNTLQELVRCLGEQNRDVEALVFAKEAIAVAPDDAGAWNNLAVALAHCGYLDEARRAIDEAVSLDPKDLSIRDIRENFDRYFGNAQICIGSVASDS